MILVGPDEDNIIPQVNSIIGSNHSSKIFFDYSFEIEKYLQLSDILCLLSYREGFGSIIIQAAAVGLTSIGSNIYGIRMQY